MSTSVGHARAPYSRQMRQLGVVGDRVIDVVAYQDPANVL
jgi:hypothetical protein